jgi:V-type H+-transporting ATPase subunit H
LLDAPLLSSALIAQPEPYKHFLAFLDHSSNPEDPIPLLASTFLTNLVGFSLTSSSKPSPRDDQALPKLFTYLSKLAKNQDSGLQDIGVQQYSVLLRTKRAKELFWKQRNETVDPLMDILRSAAGTSNDTDSTLWSGATSIRSSDTKFGGGVGLQLLYHVLLVIWQLSFQGKMVGEGLEKCVNRSSWMWIKLI